MQKQRVVPERRVDELADVDAARPQALAVVADAEVALEGGAARAIEVQRTDDLAADLQVAMSTRVVAVRRLPEVGPLRQPILAAPHAFRIHLV